MKGHLDKYTLEDREIYDPDVSRIIKDMKDNSITMHTFYYLSKNYDFTKKDEIKEEQEEEKRTENGNLVLLYYIDVPLLTRLCKAYTTEGGLENLVNKFNKRRRRRCGKTKEEKKEAKKPEKQEKNSDIDIDDLKEVCAEDDLSPPVESVIKTRVRDRNDVDFHETITFQNYFYDRELRSHQKDKGSFSGSNTVRRRNDKELDKELAKLNEKKSIAKRKKHEFLKPKDPEKSLLKHFKSS